jgi:hypothetical protein
MADGYDAAICNKGRLSWLEQADHPSSRSNGRRRDICRPTPTERAKDGLRESRYSDSDLLALRDERYKLTVAQPSPL